VRRRLLKTLPLLLPPPLLHKQLLGAQHRLLLLLI
jgi:hypothetical protein